MTTWATNLPHPAGPPGTDQRGGDRTQPGDPKVPAYIIHHTVIVAVRAGLHQQLRLTYRANIAPAGFFRRRYAWIHDDQAHRETFAPLSTFKISDHIRRVPRLTLAEVLQPLIRSASVSHLY